MHLLMLRSCIRRIRYLASWLWMAFILMEGIFEQQFKVKTSAVQPISLAYAFLGPRKLSYCARLLIDMLCSNYWFLDLVQFIPSCPDVWTALLTAGRNFIPRNWVEDALFNIKELLLNENPPEHAEDCEYARFLGETQSALKN